MEQSQVNLGQQLKVLWQHKWWIIAVAVIAGIAAFAFTTMQPAMYAATATLMTESGEQRLTAIPSGISGGLEMIYLQDIGNQIEIMRSRTVLEKAVMQVDPDLASDSTALQMEVSNLNESLDIGQIDATNLVEITVFSTDPDLAQAQANAIAQAYVEHVRSLTAESIESALADTTKRLEELQKAKVDLSISPVLPRLSAQLNLAFRELDQVSSKLDELTPESSNQTDGEGTVLTASQLASFTTRIDENSVNATNITELVTALNPLSKEKDFSARSSAIAEIESQTRVLSTKLANLSADIGTVRGVETNVDVRNQLMAIEEQLQVARASAEAMLAQITTLYGIQESYIAAGSAEDGFRARAQAIESDANARNRINTNASVLTGAVTTAASLVQEITTSPPTDTVLISISRDIPILAARASSTAGSLEAILTKIKPNTDGDILLSYSELSEIELQTRAISISLSFLVSDLTRVRSLDIDSDLAANLVDLQESVNIASNAIEGLGEEMTTLTENGGDVSYSSLDTLRQELQLALLSSDTGATRVLDTAVSTSSTSLFTRYRGVLLAIIAGFLISAVIVLVMRYFDRTVRDGNQVKNLLGMPLLATVGAVGNGEAHLSSTLDEAPAEYLESFRLLRTNLNLDPSKGKVLMVSSPKPKEGKTIVATNLARIIALQGRKVLLIDGNLHNPEIAGIFGLGGEKGLSEFLAYGKEDGIFVRETEGIDIFPGGEPSKISAELLSSPRLKAFLEKARKEYDIIIVDSAPVADWTDTRILARNIDGVVLVLRSNASNIDVVKETKQALEAVGAHIEGFVLMDGNK